MMIQIKPAVLTFLVSINAACNITNPAIIISCLLALFIIHHPMLDDANFQLGLVKSPDLTAKSVATPDLKSTATSEAKAPAASKAAQREERILTQQQIIAHWRESARDSKKPINKSDEKKNKAKKSRSEPRPAVGQPRNTGVPELNSSIIPEASIVDVEADGDGGWKLVTRKRGVTKKASMGAGHSVNGSSEDGEHK